MVNLRKRQAKASDDAPSQYAEQRYVVVRFWTAVTDSYPILIAPASCSSDESESDSEDRAPDHVGSQKHADRKVDRVTPQRVMHCPYIHPQGFLPQVSAAPTPKRRKATQEPATASMDAPLLGKSLVQVTDATSG